MIGTCSAGTALDMLLHWTCYYTGHPTLSVCCSLTNFDVALFATHLLVYREGPAGPAETQVRSLTGLGHASCRQRKDISNRIY